MKGQPRKETAEEFRRKAEIRWSELPRNFLKNLRKTKLKVSDYSRPMPYGKDES